MPEVDLSKLLECASAARKFAHTRGKRRVGAAVQSLDGTVFSGCNIQQRFHTNDLHAEVVALAMMLRAGMKAAVAIVVVSDGDGIAPCGSCRDWIMEFGVANCQIAWQGADSGATVTTTKDALLPYDPHLVQ